MEVNKKINLESASVKEKKVESIIRLLTEREKERSNKEIAIIGLSGRYPMSETLDKFWYNLSNGKSCISEIPEDCRNLIKHYNPDPLQEDMNYSKWGGFIKDVDKFDPLFFEIAPREAIGMDPQERMFLETAWGALEDAGYTPESMTEVGQSIGVFVGMMYCDYEFLGGTAFSKSEVSSGHSAYWSIANRVSYRFNFHGPSLSVDTACSSSLTAIHLACESILRDECRAAIAGGVNLILHPIHYIRLSSLNMLSKEDKCRSFGDGADGFIDGEGVGAVILKSLDDAISDGDHIYGIIKGSSINAGGKTSGYTIPNPNAQGELIQHVLKKSGVNPRTISYVEAHGTGTSLGDPIEIAGLKKAFESFTKEKQFCSIGSVKSNIGHLESAAGVAAVTKVLLQMKYKQLVPSLNSEKLNPNIDFSKTPFTVQQKHEEWKRPVIDLNGEKKEYPRIAGISSFGAGGANAHIVIEEYIAKDTERPYIKINRNNPAIIVLSAKNKDRLIEYAESLVKFLEEGDLFNPLIEVDSHGLLNEINGILYKAASTILNVSEEDLDPDSDLNIYGFDPVTLVSFSERINEEFALEIEPSLFVEYSTLDAVSKYIYIKKRFLSELAYTLQVGRTAMEERLGVLVNSVEELQEKLEGFIKDKDNIKDLYYGQVKRDKGTFAVFEADDDFKKTIESWAVKGKYSKLLSLWVKGLVFDWNKLYGENKPSRISLPTYPFAKDSYWIPESNESEVNKNNTGIETIHPLLQRNTSEITEQRFSSRFTGEEVFLKDHKIKGRHVLPGVAYLEMARKAVEESTKSSREESSIIRLKNITWSRPVIVGEESIETHIGLYPKDNGMIEYEIYSEGEEVDAELEVYSQGVAELVSVTESPILDIETLRSECKKEISSSECYEIFKKIGMEYGPGHQGIKKLYTGIDQVLAELSMPGSVSETVDRYILHPSIMDSALQACIGLAMSAEVKEEASMNASIPFALDELEIYGRCSSEMWSYIRYSEGSKPGDKVEKLDIDICDEKGNVSMRLKGFTSLKLKGEDIGRKRSRSGTLMIRPIWKEDTVREDEASYEYNRHVLIVCEGEDVSEEAIKRELEGTSCVILRCEGGEIGERYQSYAVKIFEEVQRLLKDKPKDKVLMQVISRVDSERQMLRGLSGLIKTVQLENPYVIGQVIGVDRKEGTEGIIEKVRENLRRPHDKEVLYESGRRLVLGWEKVKRTEEGNHPWKENGVYLITGGFGGLGQIFAREITEQTKGSTLILTGRSELIERKRSQLKEIEKLGSRVEYRQIDVCDRMSVKKLIEDIKNEFGGLNGIIHSAGMIRDNFIIRKTKEEMREVLLPKVRGLVNLDVSSKDMDLDLFILFSSNAGAMGNVGQSDYATGNAFMDVYAGYRNELVRKNERRGQTLSINWPLWKEGGMEVDEATVKMMSGMGMTAMESKTGVRAFYRCLSSGHDQVMVIEGDIEKINRLFMKRNPINVLKGNDNIGTQKNAKIIDNDKMLKYVKTVLINIVSELLKIKMEGIDTNAEWSSFGFDSVYFAKFSQILNEEYNLDLAPTIYFEYQNINDLAQYLVEEYQSVFSIMVDSDPGEKIDIQIKKNNIPIEKNKIKKIQKKRRFFKIKENIKTCDPVAIVGISARLPMAKDYNEFWKNILEGKDCTKEIQDNRWDWNEYYNDPAKKEPEVAFKVGGFIDDVDKFDAEFFGIPSHEAQHMDPQHRIFLETVWKTIEDAGYRASDLSGTKTGLYVGVSSSDYTDILMRSRIDPEISTGLGMNHSMLANRISYLLNFHGPSEPIETECSSSLVAIHHAVESIWNGNCDNAIAGGINLNLTPTRQIAFMEAGSLSHDGICKTFDKRADGFARGEGSVAIFLKPLKKAREDGDNIYAIIKSTSVNHGGRAVSLTSPNANAYTDLLVEAYEKVNIDPNTISYIEAHAPGTHLGDPIEINSIKKAFKELYRRGENSISEYHYCGIGSVKPNIGHLEAPSGIAGLIKVILSMKYKTLPATIHFNELNPYIKLENSPFYIVDKIKNWNSIIDKNGKEVPRRAGISSFGLSGVNAHVVLEEYKDTDKKPDIDDKGLQIIVVSAKNEERLRKYIEEIIEFLEKSSNTRQEETDDLSNIPVNDQKDLLNNENRLNSLSDIRGIGLFLKDIAYTLQTGREEMEERVAVVASSIDELLVKLRHYLESNTNIDGLYKGNLKKDKIDLEFLNRENEIWDEFIARLFKKKKLDAIAKLWVSGVVMDWYQLYIEGHAPRRIALPTYPFARKRYWIESSNEEKNKKSRVLRLSNKDKKAGSVEEQRAREIELTDNMEEMTL